MTRITGRTVFDRPVEDLFDFLADPRNEPRYNPVVIAAEKTTPGPIGVGTRFVQRARSFGRVGDVEIEVVSYARPDHLGFAIKSAGMDVRGEQTFSRQPPGCLVTWAWDLRPRGPWRLPGPLFGLAGRRLEPRVWREMKAYVDTIGTRAAAR
jgi:Polyketide cyclase / dehydrase and lipid transport